MCPLNSAIRFLGEFNMSSFFLLIFDWFGARLFTPRSRCGSLRTHIKNAAKNSPCFCGDISRS